ncbi:MAG: NrsF family protein [Sphingomonadaceae bacterium]
MITTPELIALLTASARPVRRLRPPMVRTGLWLSLAAAVFALLALGHGVRTDFAQRIEQPVFVIGLAASLVTGVLAAIASFMTSLPDRSRAWVLLPVPSLLIWISTVSYGCLTNWVEIGPNGMRVGEAAQCFATLLLTSLPLSVALYVMLRHAAWMRTTAVALTGSLAVAAMTATALSLFHDLDATIMVLLWNLGIAAMIVAMGGVVGLRARAWP